MQNTFDFNRVVQATSNVQKLLLLAIQALESSRISYALTDDIAVAAWVAAVDESAVGNAPDVSMVINGHDFDRAAGLLISTGLSRSPDCTNLFVESPSARHGVRLFIAGNRMARSSAATHPNPAQSQMLGQLRILSLQPLLQIKLSTFRDRDRLNIRDLIDVGLIDATWPARFPGELAPRLQLLLDTPEG
jgi:hypothetical protein